MRVKEFGESDLLVHFFSSDKGRLKGIAKGARRSRKRFINCLDIFSLVNLEYSPSKKDDLLFLYSGKLIDAYPGLRTDYATLSKASYMIELTEALFPWELPDRRIFETLKSSFHSLSMGKLTDLIPIIFECLAMSLGGYRMNLDKCCICGRKYHGQGLAAFKPEKGGIACLNCHHISPDSPRLSPDTAKLLRLIQSRSLEVFENSDYSAQIMAEIKSILRLHREYHLGKRLRTAGYLE